MKINTKSINIQWLIMTIGLVLMICAQSFAAEKPKMATDIPPEITTSDKVETQIGTLEFFDGMPGKETVQEAYDNLDFMLALRCSRQLDPDDAWKKLESHSPSLRTDGTIL